jgi:hypothetical protein
VGQDIAFEMLIQRISLYRRVRFRPSLCTDAEWQCHVKSWFSKKRNNYARKEIITDRTQRERGKRSNFRRKMYLNPVPRKRSGNAP